MRKPLSLAILLAATGAVSAARAAVSGLVFFGDSLSDVGNVWDQTFHLAPQSPPYFQGRYSNGPLWNEQLALELSLPVPTPSRLGGRDYAYAGTKTGSGSTFIFPFSFPNIGSQINSYLGANTPAPDQLFVIWGGGNDFIDGQSNPSVPVTNVSNHVTALANAGARQFLVPNLPPLGKVPRFRGTANEATMDARSGQFNAQLATTLDNLELSLNVQIWQLDVGGLFADLLSNPSAYGFTNTTDPALVGNTPVPNQDEYVFWDDIHPTRVAHRLLGQIAGDLVATHHWVSPQSSGNWSDPINWDPQGTPSSQWIAQVINATLASPQTVMVDQSSAVRRVLVRGDMGEMNLLVPAGVALTATRVEISSGGRLGGGGMVNADVVNGGVVAPESVLSVSGSYTQQSGAILAIDLSGTQPQQIDRLDISGSALLDGSLAVHLTGGFIALPGQTFTVMNFTTRTGDLTVVNETAFAGLRFDKLFGSSDLTLLADATDGDANLDGAVNLFDFNILAANFGASDRTWLEADFSGDGLVNLTDFNLLAANFGLSPLDWGPSPQDWATLSASVPEPVSIGLLVPALLMARRRDR